MKIEITNKELKKAIIKEASKQLLSGKENWLQSYFPLKDLAKEIIKNTPEIKEIVSKEIKKQLKDKSFLQSSIRQIFINELKTDYED